MARLSEFQLEFIYHILDKITLCEGGYISVYYTEDGDCIMELFTDIPIEFWCDDCKKRAICKTKIMYRWARKLKPHNIR